MKLSARQRRFWHCLFGMFTGHRMADLYNCEQECFTDRPYREVLVEMGCACGRVFWRARNTKLRISAPTVTVILSPKLDRGEVKD